jgi:hypothetical protein
MVDYDNLNNKIVEDNYLADSINKRNFSVQFI